MNFAHTNLDSSFEEQVVATLDYCRTRIPFYAAHWPSSTTERFSELPIIDKSQIRRRQSDFYNSELAVGGITHTSGTTGDPLFVPKSISEIAFLNDVLDAINRVDLRNRRPLGLSIRDNVHGHGPSYRSETLWLGDPSFSPSTLELGRQYLTRRFELPRCEDRITSIFMSTLEILHFTAFLKLSGFNPKAADVRTVFSTGFPMCATWHSAIAEFWQCDHVDAFSLTELFGQALTCNECGRYHWDPFNLVEFLSPLSFSPVVEGVATMVISTLYPYAQIMPLIRYNTGDLVWVSRNCPHGISFTPMGRMANALKLGDGVLAPLDTEILEVLAKVNFAQRSMPFALRSLKLQNALGYGMPIVAAELKEHTISITLAVENQQEPSSLRLRRVEDELVQACHRVLRKIGRDPDDFVVTLVTGPSIGGSSEMFGCPTAGIPSQ